MTSGWSLWLVTGDLILDEAENANNDTSQSNALLQQQYTLILIAASLRGSRGGNKPRLLAAAVVAEG